MNVINKLLAHPDIIINAENNEKKTPLDATDKIVQWGYDASRVDRSGTKQIKDLLIAHGGKKHSEVESKAKLENCIVQ
jgi:hypothetical protein